MGGGSSLLPSFVYGFRVCDDHLHRHYSTKGLMHNLGCGVSSHNPNKLVLIFAVFRDL